MFDEEKEVDPMNATSAQKLKILSEKLALLPWTAGIEAFRYITNYCLFVMSN